MNKKKLKKQIRRVYKTLEYWYYHSILQKNRTLQNKYKGKRIFVLGDGVSLKEIDLAKLKGEFTFGCNHLMVHKDFQKLNVNFYSIIEPWSVAKRDRTPILGGVIQAFHHLEEKIEDEDIKLFFSASIKKQIEKRNLFKNKDIFYLVSGKSFEEAQEIDLSKPLSTMDGSLYFMIAAAIFMGFKEIYIGGAGYTYSPQQYTHFYDGFEKLVDDPPDPRHLLMKKFAEEQGVSLFNITPHGHRSPVYPEIRLEDVYKIISSKNEIKTAHTV